MAGMKKSLLIAIAALFPALALAWGQEGHSIVAELAQRQLSPQARQATQDLMGPGVSLASLSTWADTVAYATRKDTKGWHYVDIGLLLKSFSHERDCVYMQKGQPDTPDVCIIRALELNRSVLANPQASPAERRQALKFLVHFVGDIHQPMHTVLEEAGGNGVQIGHFPTQPNNPRRTSSTNLHAVWDTGIFRAQYYTWGEHLDVLSARWFDDKPLPPLPETCPAAEKRFECWAMESHAIAAKPGVWVEKGSNLGLEYVQLVAEDRDLQLVRASMRLAALLNEVLGR